MERTFISFVLPSRVLELNTPFLVGFRWKVWVLPVGFWGKSRTPLYKILYAISAASYISGGIVPRLGAFFAQSEFRSRFEMKGRFHDYLEKIPTRVIVWPLPALARLIALLKRS
jgi:hypothetical protein